MSESPENLEPEEAESPEGTTILRAPQPQNDSPDVLVVEEEFREAGDPLTDICSGPGEETNTDIWTQ